MDLSVKKPEGIIALLAGLAALGFVWMDRSQQHEPVESAWQQQLADHFKADGNAARAAHHARKAEELKSAE
jgi:hypothetical protein